MRFHLIQLLPALSFAVFIHTAQGSTPLPHQHPDKDSATPNKPQKTSTHAQQSSSNPETLAPVKVYANTYRSTGTKTDLSPMEAPMSYEVYDADYLRQHQVDSINEALRYVPGITTENRSTATLFDQYTIRGFVSYNNYYNGLPLQYIHNWNLYPQVDAFATQSIEVLKGPTSSLYGSAPPGGMINQIGKQPERYEHTQLKLSTGNNYLQELGIDHNGVVNDDFDYRIVALARKQHAQMKTTRQERKLFAPSATWRITPKTTLNLNLYYQDDPKLVPSTPLPAAGAVYAAPWGKLASDAYAGDKNWNNAARRVTMLGYKINHRFNNHLKFLQNFRYTKGSLLQRNTYTSSISGPILNRNAYETDEKMNGYAIDNQLAWDTKLGSTEHKLLFGIDYQRLQSSVTYQDTFGSGTPSINLADPNYYQFNPSSIVSHFTYKQTSSTKSNQLGLYAQDEMHWKSFTLLGDIRHDHYRSDDNQITSGSASSTKIDQHHISTRLAGIYTFDNGLAPYLSYATSYQPTSGRDVKTGKTVKPTTAKQYEVGVKFKTPSRSIKFTAAAFDIIQSNIVKYDSAPANYTQVGEVTSKGIETTLWSRLTEQLDVQANYTYQHVEVTKNADSSLIGKTPVWVANTKASIWGTYYMNPAFDFSLGIRYVGKTPIDDANSDFVSGHTLADLASTYRFNDNYKVNFTVTNLTNKRYVGACYDTTNCWMGAEREAKLSLLVDF
ncbi:TonB-dependent siderophore receptor [Celerinatantimonas diazotrophica]|uniref:Iron complex outermembrane receptor protein n=1 Tax=Celerinatantimonas diazotrophica TaxID=412034 RepID=A0A4R1J8J4_9GAMM|nr:TonB-dependent siderophore receptor [Celerinatantimonas diazotrophica]TCK46677.1 iron complex outermembrane receptor protein [Celerinatantimonas diazotrophica]CAG9295379.1 Ferrichrome outer membrane transporter/phage receptor [Celerinatantimonas diazotrophica]